MVRAYGGLYLHQVLAGQMAEVGVMSELPVLEPIKPIAKCGACNENIYPDGQCRNGNRQPPDCPLRGEHWRQIKMALDMRNVK